MRKIWETGIVLFSAMGFWGMIYPDLCFTGDVCAVVCEETEDAEGGSGTGVGGSEARMGESGTGMDGSGARIGGGGTGIGGSETGISGSGTGMGGSEAGIGSGRAGEGARDNTDSTNNNGGQASINVCGTQEDMFTRICSANPGQIRIKSKFLEAIGLDKLLQ